MCEDALGFFGVFFLLSFCSGFSSRMNAVQTFLSNWADEEEGGIYVCA